MFSLFARKSSSRFCPLTAAKEWRSALLSSPTSAPTASCLYTMIAYLFATTPNATLIVKIIEILKDQTKVRAVCFEYKDVPCRSVLLVPLPRRRLWQSLAML